MLLEHLKFHGLHCDAGPESVWVQPATTAWMVWNVPVSGLLLGAAITTFDGDVTYPDPGELWRLASDVRATHIGTAAAVISAAAKTGLDVSGLDLSAVREVLSTGSPLSGEGFEWIQRRIRDDIPISSASGGTDVCSIFVGGSHVLPVTRGEITCRALAVAVEAFDQDGNSVTDEQGELVVTAPMLSMPVGFWGDDDGSMYTRSYFGTYPGVWRHGDWITIMQRGTAIIPGRSDATLNRGGVQMGTAEFYGVLDACPEITDSVVVHVERQDSDGAIVVLAVPQHAADGRSVTALIRQTLRSRLSPRHSPDAVYLVPVLPRTMTNKRLEVPIKRILEGVQPSAVLRLDAVTGAEGVDVLVRLAQVPISGDRDERPIAGLA